MRMSSKFVLMILTISVMAALGAVLLTTVLGIARSSQDYQKAVLQGTEERSELPDNIIGRY